MNEITAAIRNKALERFPEPANGFWTETQKFHVEKLREAYTSGAEDMFKFRQILSDDFDEYLKEPKWECLDEQRGYRWGLQEGEFYTTEQLLLKHLGEQNAERSVATEAK